MYTFFIYVYSVAVRWLAVAGNPKARQLFGGQKEVWQQSEDKLQPGEQRIWIHCASVGEFEQGRPLMEDIREQYPSYKIVVTFFSPSGYELRKNYAGVDYVFYLPYDTPGNARRFVSRLQPQKVYFIKYEFWRNYLREISRRQIPLYLVSANFRKGQVFFKWYGGWYRRLLKTFTWFFVQNERSRILLAGAGYRNVTVTGDTRFDRVCRMVARTQNLPLVERFVQGKKCVVAGSIWSPDADMLVRYIRAESRRELKWILAPHELHEAQLEQLVQTIVAGGKRAVRYSRLTEPDTAANDVLVIDNIGMLSSLYRYGTAAYIGGGFGKGIHNILEAAVYGIPVLFGPAYKKFQEAVDLSGQGGAFPVQGYDDFSLKLNELLDDPEKSAQAGEIAGAFVASGKGATEKVMRESFQEGR
ncbi:MAG: 3-deoxy-D-manno-octulosonic acid transferase [Bacteroidales bacterium]|jgi:3-deoxy-D-manno-octulosonic-acid transferase|nr:3-deoxy-D-manno-octulosonic acid transferase [Bacteroidales bacterium]